MADAQYARRRAPPPLEPTGGQIYSHSRTRTTSSNTFPDQVPAPTMTSGIPMHMQMHLAQPQAQHQRRSSSINTFSSVSSTGVNGMVPPAAYRTSPTNDIRRSISSRSGGATPGSPQPTSYVALLRKQKATVWCDRAQYEDPRLMAQQRAAKMRANLEIVGTSHSGLGSGHATSARTSTGLSSAGGKIATKIRHHNKPTVVGYSPENNYVGVGGVPLRLSATEVEGEDSDEDDPAMTRLHHRRTGSSGRSSTASGRKALAYRTSGTGLGANPQQQGAGRRWSPGDTPERTGSLVVEEEGEYAVARDSESGKARSVGSGSSGERLDAVPDMANKTNRLATNSAKNSAVTREKSVKGADDLKRRGSVDERTMTLTTGRLYIANPD